MSAEGFPIESVMTSPSKEHSIVGAAGAITVKVTAQAVGAFRMNLSVHHLLVAARLAREVRSVENANAGAEFGDFYDVILGSSMGCIVLAAAGAEGYINEVFADRGKLFTGHDQAVLTLLWDKCEMGSALDKFDLAVKIRTGAPMDRGVLAVQDFDRLFKLRNGLAHFKPEWSDEQAGHLKLSRQLEGYVSRSPWLAGEPLFPRAWATGATASWAIRTVVSFIGHFSSVCGIPNRVSKFEDRLGTDAG
jgi:hypothetical protein